MLFVYTRALRLLGVCSGIVCLLFFKQSRRESLVLTYALDEVCLASADRFVNGTEARFELGARQVFQYFFLFLLLIVCVLVRAFFIITFLKFIKIIALPYFQSFQIIFRLQS